MTGLTVFLAGTYSRPYVFGGITQGSPSRILNNSGGVRDIKLYLAGVAPWREGGLYDATISTHRPFILESFYYADEITEKLLPYFGDFLLDSGAFTFMTNTKTAVDWDDYIKRYAAFIKKHNIKKYFELDIDVIVGYDKVKQIRSKLESLVGWQSIPVWHISRGIKEFRDMCTEYSYVALGGIVSGEWSPKAEAQMPLLISEAHKRGCKIHGLGFTKLNLLPKYHFDSADSTAWTTGNRFGFLYKFDGKTMQKIKAPKGTRLADPRAVALNNYVEWIKFQKYAINHL